MPSSRHFPDAQALQDLLEARIDEQRAGGVVSGAVSGVVRGIVVGVVDADGTSRIAAYGDPGPGALPLGPDSVFEIGSVTKAFTGVLLAEMTARGEVDPDVPAQRYAPPGLILPMRGGRAITLNDLATHTSGLPRLPGNLSPPNPSNPYAHYTVAMLYEFLAGCELPRAIGSVHEYSNLGMGLLGHLLAARAGLDYETLVRTRILDPLGMTMTGLTLSAAMQAKLTVGHDRQGRPTVPWDLGTLAGAGGLRSSVHDMLRFLRANLGEPKSDLERAMRTSHQPVRSAGVPIGLAWHLLCAGRSTIVFHDGATAGCRSFLGFDPERRVGVVVLANSCRDVGDLALALIDPTLAIRAPASAGTAVVVPAHVLERYIGDYEYRPTFRRTATLSVTLEDGVLMIEGDGPAKAPLAAESETRFFAGCAALTFVIDRSGTATGLVLDRGRFSRTVKKVR